LKVIEVPQQGTWREGAPYDLVRVVVRRIGGRNSHPEFHRVLANGRRIRALPRAGKLTAARFTADPDRA